MIGFIVRHFGDSWQVVRYGIAGIVGMFLQVVSLYFFVELLHAWYLVGVLFAFLIALVVVFLLQKYWTFKDRSRHAVGRQSSTYTAVALASLLGNIGIMYVLVDVVGVWYLLAQIVTAVAVGVGSFLANKTMTFAPTQHHPYEDTRDHSDL